MAPPETIVSQPESRPTSIVDHTLWEFLKLTPEQLRERLSAQEDAA